MLLLLLLIFLAISPDFQGVKKINIDISEKIIICAVKGLVQETNLLFGKHMNKFFNVSKNNLVQCSKNDNTEYVCEYEDDDGKANGLQDLTTMSANADGTIATTDPESDIHHTNQAAIYKVVDDLRNIERQITSLVDLSDDSNESGGIHYHNDGI